MPMTKGILHRDHEAVEHPDRREQSAARYRLRPGPSRVEGGESLTGTGAILGTASYMSPEQAEGTKTPTAREGDVYSLGAILYEMLTGRPPFLAASVVETLLLVRSEEPVRPRALNPQIDVDLEFICRKCLEKSPAHRYAAPPRSWRTISTPSCTANRCRARSSSLVYFLHPAVARDASCAGLGKLGLALDVAQLADLPAVRGHQRDVLLRNRRPLELHGPVEHWPGCVGRDLLEPASARRAGDVRRTADRPFLGGGRHRIDWAVRRRDHPGNFRCWSWTPVLAVAGGDGVPGDGRDPCRLVLHRGGVVLLERGADGMLVKQPWSPLLFSGRSRRSGSSSPG